MFPSSRKFYWGENRSLVPSNLGARRVAVLCFLVYTLGATCDTAFADMSANRLSEIWREEFPATEAPVQNVGMAPPSFDTAKTVPSAGMRGRQARPHPAVARIIVPEAGATAFGSGTLIDVRGKFGMVITNWHVVRDATDTIEVVFPDGFSSKARALKVDSDWDLAALVIWRPNVEPVKIATVAPRPGDTLTICGYGQGNYRSATGRCTQYYAPRQDFPRHMGELDVEARQGDSGGPIFNPQGELAGVLFGAGQGTTLGSFGGRVGAFLASLAPDIGQAEDALAHDEAPQTELPREAEFVAAVPAESTRIDQPAASTAVLRPHDKALGETSVETAPMSPGPQSPGSTDVWPTSPAGDATLATASPPQAPEGHWRQSSRQNFFEQMKTALAAIGLVTVVVQVLRVAR